MAFEEEHFFADDFDDFFSLVQKMFLGYGVGGGMDGLAALEVDGDDRDMDGR